MVSHPGNRHQPQDSLELQPAVLEPNPVYQEASTSLGNSLLQGPAATHQDLVQPTSRPAPVPRTPRLCSQLCWELASLTSGLAATRQGMAWQPTGLGASPAYQHVHSSWFCHRRKTHTAHIVGTPRAYSSGDWRGV